MKKYKLTRIKVKATLNDKEVTLYRIRALTNIYNSVGTLIVEKGQKGGFVESEENLSQLGGCWVGDNSMVFGGAKVQDDARVLGSAVVCQNSILKNNAVVCDNAQIKNSIVSNHARVTGNTKIEDESNITDSVCVDGDCKVTRSDVKHDVKISDNVCIKNSVIRNNVTISGQNANIDNSVIDGWAKLEGEFKIIHSSILGHATITGKSFIKHTEIYSNVHISGESEIIGDTLPVIIDDNVEVIDSKINGAYVIKDNAKIVGEKLINTGKVQLIKYTDASPYIDLE